MGHSEKSKVLNSKIKKNILKHVDNINKTDPDDDIKTNKQIEKKK